MIPAVVLLAFLASAFGWGQLPHLLGRIRAEGLFLSTTYGLAIIILLGGILNAAGLASSAGLLVIFFAGLCFSLYFAICRLNVHRASNAGESRTQWPRIAAVWAMPVLIGIFLVVTLLPSQVYNAHDDFQSYFPRPMRMLQTGSIGGNPFDFLGVDSLGAHGFLQGFWVLWLPVEYINGFDAVCCVFLAAALIVELSIRFRLHWLFAVCAVLAFILPNTQAVNTSALYSGSVIMVSLIITGVLLVDSLAKDDLRSTVVITIVHGILLASLFLLKNTFAPFVALYALLLFGLTFLTMARKRRVIGTAILTALSAFATVLPWILINLQSYLAVARQLGPSVDDGTSTVRLSAIGGRFSDLFSFDSLFYGNRYFDYDVMFVVLGIVSVLLVYLMLKSPFRERDPYSIAGIAACLAAAGTFLADGYAVRAADAVRYWCPVLVGTLPVAVLLVGRHLGQPAPLHAPQSPPDRKQHPHERRAARMLTLHNRAIVTGLIAILVTMGILFGAEFVKRLQRAYDAHTIVSYPFSENYSAYNASALSEQSRTRFREIQSKTPAGETIMVYATTPFHLDFSRNRLLSAPGPGLASPWLALPVGTDHVTLRDFLREKGVRYVMWEYQSYGMKSDVEYRWYLTGAYSQTYEGIAKCNLYLREGLSKLRAECEVLHDESGLVLFDIGAEQASEPSSEEPAASLPGTRRGVS